MRALIDTHTLVWAAENPLMLGPSASIVLFNLTNDLAVSAGTIWELSIKVGLGKIMISKPYRQWIEQTIIDLDLSILPIEIPHA